MKDKKTIQKDSLAALRSETLGFGMMPTPGFEFMFKENFEAPKQTAPLPHPEPTFTLSLETALIWFKRRLRRWRRAFSP